MIFVKILVKVKSKKIKLIIPPDIKFLCCASMNRGKKFMVIGKNQNLQCFKGEKTLPVDKAKKSAWMTEVILKDWLIN